jgi:hypothetical protein
VLLYPCSLLAALCEASAHQSNVRSVCLEMIFLCREGFLEIVLSARIGIEVMLQISHQDSPF